jgi:hypothetical protein
VKKIAVCALFVLLGLALSAPTVAHAKKISSQEQANKQTQKNWKKAGKQQTKAQKKQMKAQKKQMKQWSKEHPTKTSTTTTRTTT